MNSASFLIRCFLLLTVVSSPIFAGLSEIRSVDGTGNNLSNPTWGSANTPLLRDSPLSYMDQMGDTLVDWGNPRLISNSLSTYSGPKFDSRMLSSMVWQWGQFIDHDISLTEAHVENGTADIPVMEESDILYPSVSFVRSNHVGGDSVETPRQQVNQITAFIDASNVYGSDETTMNQLRSFSDGRLQTSAGNLMQQDADGHFMGGDVRANEQLGLISMHTLFTREHNRIADRILANATDLPTDPILRDENVFQRARKVVGAQLQAITYKEFLPALLGPHAPSLEDAQYDPTVNATINNEFSTVLFRFGHSMLNPELMIVNDEGVLVDEILLRDAFFRPDLLAADPELMDGLLKGLSEQRAQKVDVEMIDDVRSFLFGNGFPGLDLAALNIQRSRDHGIADYNTLRETYGMSSMGDFDEITTDVELRERLRSAYVNVDQMDSWIAALGEEHVEGSSLGGLATVAVAKQFTKLRDGDRFFYLYDPDIQQLAAEAGIDFDELRLADVIMNNTSITNIRENVFVIPEPHSSLYAVIGLIVGVLRIRRVNENSQNWGIGGAESRS